MSANVNRSGPMEIRFLNPLGSVVLSEDLFLVAGKNEYHLDISAMPAGLYFIRCKIGHEELYRKVVKE